MSNKYSLLPSIKRRAEEMLAAPRPLLIQNNANDPRFPISGFMKAKAELKTVYEAFGCPDRLEMEISSTMHDVTPEFTARIIEWLGRFL